MTERMDMTPRRFGKYVLLERVGRGGMAEVYRARMFGPGGFAKDCAIKRILPTLLDDEQFVRMFIDEARLTAHLTHPNIVQVLELGELGGDLFIAMEYISGKDLLDLLARCARKSRRIPRELVLYIMMEVLRALDYAHNAIDDQGEPIGIVHRDVSPSNVLLSYTGSVKIGDFGIARSRIQTNKTEIGTQKGKMGYMSPEQVTGSPIDRRSDLFAASVIFFEMLTMSRLFKAENDLEVMLKIRDCQIDGDLERMRSLPDELQAIVRRGLAREAHERYQTAHEFYSAIARFVFRNEIEVGATNLEAFMRDVFADLIAEEMANRARDPHSDPGELIGANDVPTLRYRDDGGRIHGPMSQGMMEELLESRPPSDAERISVRGGPWVPVHTVPELASLARGAAPEPGTSQHRLVPVSEDFDGSLTAPPLMQSDPAPRDTTPAATAPTLTLGPPPKPAAESDSGRMYDRPRMRVLSDSSQGGDAFQSPLPGTDPGLRESSVDEFLSAAGLSGEPAQVAAEPSDKSGIASLLEAYLSDIGQSALSTGPAPRPAGVGPRPTTAHARTALMQSRPSRSVSPPPPVSPSFALDSAFEDEMSTPANVRHRTADWEELSLAGMNPNRRRKRASTAGVDAVSDDVGAVPAWERVAMPFGPPAIEGALDRASVARLLLRIHSRGLTGMLQVHNAQLHKEIFFREGLPVCVFSSIEEELLGHILLRQGAITNDQLLAGISGAQGNHVALGDELVRQGVIAPHKLFHHLSEQMREKLANALFITDAQWRWWGGARTNIEPMPIPIDLPGLVNRTMLEYVTGPFCRRFFEGRMGSRIDRVVEVRDLSRIPLAPRALRLATMLNPRDTPAAIVQRFTEQHRWREAEVYQLLYLLVEFEAIRLATDIDLRMPGD